ncbi:MAG: hypothetical protein IJY39_14675 [Clostridia bacterium]|nr:hypothetical protein [Clostridia bacterium]
MGACIKGRRLAIIGVLLCLTLLMSCGTKGLRDPFAYCDRPFSVTVEGTVDGVYMKAFLQCDFSEQSTEEQRAIMNVSYLAPESLCGIVLTLYANGQTSARLGNMQLGDQSLEGMAEPLLFLYSEDEIAAVRIEDGMHILELVSDGKLTLSFDGQGGCPVSAVGMYRGREVSLRFSDFVPLDK